MAKSVLVCLCALLGASGCAVTFNDSAPATAAGSRYVVGSKASEPAVFLCPEKPGECQLVEVEER